MIRRRRPQREIPFSFDSFLDVVANVVGIIIRLILVVWVGARSYSSLTTRPAPAPADTRKGPPARDPDDPLKQELARHQQELAAAQARLLEQLRQVHLVQTNEDKTRSELATVKAQGQELRREKARIDRTAARHQAEKQTVVLSLEEIQKRSRQLRDQIQALEKLPPLKHTLRYRTPVSAPVDSEEILFECRGGRVTYINIAALLNQVERTLEDKGKQLESRWQVQDVTEQVGAFRLHYTVERSRGLMDGFGASSPAGGSGYRYGLSAWQLEPRSAERGETETEALALGSEFREVADALDPRQYVVTIFVYPDSFALYRRLRDYLYDREVVVAGRPLPEGIPISCSRGGTRSRGQ